MTDEEWDQADARCLGMFVSGEGLDERDFAAQASREARCALPDPNAETTFQRSRLDWDCLAHASHAHWLTLHRRLLANPGPAPGRGFTRPPGIPLFAVPEGAVAEAFDGAVPSWTAVWFLDTPQRGAS